MRILFLLRQRHDNYMPPFGLSYSAQFIADMLAQNGYDTKVVQVVDSNSIDREVTLYQPDHAIIEALWVPPYKFEELFPLHPKVEWTVRVHSKAPFLAMEGMAIEWIKYIALKGGFAHINLASNNLAFANDLTNILHTHTAYLPNYYQISPVNKSIWQQSNVLSVGCFGAIRPLKNQLQQAMAAMLYAEKTKRSLFFYINSDRVEQNGSEVLKNLRALFERTNHKLVEVPWQNHSSFLQLVSTMDIGMQVSLSESFNIVTADFVSQNVPMVVSPEVSWMPSGLQADPNDLDDIVNKLRATELYSWIYNRASIKALNNYNKLSKKTWLQYLAG